MIRLTRLNQQAVVVNPDNILWADSSPDTVLCFVGGDRLIVREPIEEVMALVVKFQQRLRTGVDTGQFRRPGESTSATSPVPAPSVARSHGIEPR